MNSIFKSFYAKLTAAFLILLMILGVAMAFINYHSYTQLIQEAEQRLNRDLAKNMASELEPLIQDSLDIERMKHAIHYMMVFNPRIEIYLLDENGEIQAFFAEPPQRVKAERVNLEPISRYIDGKDRQLILGPDPRQPGVKKPFSAAEFNLQGREGYVYIILGSQKFESALGMVKNSYIFRTGLAALTGVVVVTGLVGLILFFVLTKRVRSLAEAVQQFEQGDLNRRVQVESDDEISQLAHSFNSMADSIESYIARIRANDRVRRELVANISHDLRSPLASIQGYLETILIKDDKLEADQRKTYLKTILKNTTVLSKLVEDLFELSKLEAKQVETKPEPISISELCQDVVLKFRPEAEKNNIELVSDINQTLPFVMVDISLIERAISNLLRNALQYTPKDGKVWLKTEQVNGTVRVSVADTGFGISEEDLPHIFDRFYKGRKQRSRDKGNSGLGLAISQKIIELHDSNIEVKSRPEQGTIFFFNLPIVEN